MKKRSLTLAISKIAFLGMLLIAPGLSTLAKKEKIHISLFEGDKTVYPINHFVDLEDADSARFWMEDKNSPHRILNLTQKYQIYSIKNTSLTGNISLVRQQMNQRIAVFTQNGYLLNFKTADDGKIEEIHQRIKIDLEQNYQNCFDILPGVFTDIDQLACLSKKKDSDPDLVIISMNLSNGKSNQNVIKLTKKELSAIKSDLKFLKFKLFRPPMSMIPSIIMYRHDPLGTTASKSVHVRVIVFDDNFPLRVRRSFTIVKSLIPYGIHNPRGISYYNNDRLMLLAESVQKKKNFKFFCEIEIDIEKEKMEVVVKKKVENIQKMKNVVEQLEGHLLGYSPLRKEVRACNIVKPVFLESCLIFKNTVVGDNERISRFSLKENHLGIFEFYDEETGQYRVEATFGVVQDYISVKYEKFEVADKRFLLVNTHLYLFNSSTITVHNAIEPHLVLDFTSNSTVGVSFMSTDVDQKTDIKTEIGLKISKGIKNRIQDLPHLTDVEVYGDRHHFLRVIRFDNIQANIKEYRLKSLNNSNWVDIELRMDEEIDFLDFEDDDQIAVDHQTLVSLNDGRSLTIYSACTFRELSRDFHCDEKMRKLLSEKMVLGHVLADTDFCLVELKHGNLTTLAFHGYFQGNSDFAVPKIELKPLGSLKREPRVSSFVKLNQADYAYIACYYRYCLVYKLEFSTKGIDVVFIGQIDSFLLKISKFCPKKIFTTSEEDHDFYILSYCNKGPKYLSKFSLVGQTLSYAGAQKIPAKSLNVKVCGRNQFILFSKHSPLLAFRNFQVPPNLDSNTIDLTEIGIEELIYAECRYSSIVLIGKEVGNSKGNILAILSMRYTDETTTYMDRKSSMVRFVSTFPRFQKVTSFMSKFDQKEGESLVYIMVENELKSGGVNRRLFGVRSEIGPIAYIKPKNEENESRVTEFQLTAVGFENEFSGNFKVFRKFIDRDFDVSVLSSRPKIKERIYKLEDLVLIKGFVVQLRTSKDPGFTIFDSINQIKMPEQKAQKIHSIVKYKDINLGLTKKGIKLTFNIFKNINTLRMKFIDEADAIKLEGYQMTIFKRPNGDIYLLYSFIEESQNFVLRKIPNNITKVKTYDGATLDTNMKNVYVFAKEINNKEEIFFVGKQSKHVLVYRFEFYQDSTYLQIYKFIDADYDAFDILRNDDNIYIVSVENKNEIYVQRINLEDKDAKEEKFKLDFEIKTNVIYLKCSEYDNEQLYPDLIGHCLAMSEVRTHHHIQIPLKASSIGISNKQFFLYDEFIKLTTDNPLWTLSDNFMASYVEFNNTATKKKIKGLVLWKFAKIDGYPYRFFPYKSKYQAFSLTTDKDSIYDVLYLDKSSKRKTNFMKISLDNEIEISVEDKKKLLTQNGILKFIGLDKVKELRVKTFFEKIRIKQDSDFNLIDKNLEDLKQKSKKKRKFGKGKSSKSSKGGKGEIKVPEYLLKKIAESDLRRKAEESFMSHWLTTFFLGVIACSLLFIVFKMMKRSETRYVLVRKDDGTFEEFEKTRLQNFKEN